MSNSILSKLPFDPVILIIILLMAIIILFVMVMTLYSSQKKLLRHYKSFMRGRDGKSLEQAILQCFDEIDEITDVLKQQNMDIGSMNHAGSSNFQKMGLVKYDAFQEMGGKMSFALTLLDEKNNGFILNAMHSREGCYTYIKEIIKGESFIALADEEAESLEKALNVFNFTDTE